MSLSQAILVQSGQKHNYRGENNKAQPSSRLIFDTPYEFG